VGFSRLILPNALPEGVWRLVSEVAAMSTSRVVALSLVVVVDAAVLCAGANAQAVSAPLVTVALQVVPKDEISGIAWTAMTKEARTIWAREGVELIFDAADTAVALA